MSKKSLLFISFSMILGIVKAQTIDSLKSTPPIIFKIGGQLNVDILGRYGFLQADVATEVPIGSKFSAIAGFNQQFAKQRFVADGFFTLGIRYFLKKDTISPIISHPKRVLAGTYISPTYSFQNENVTIEAPDIPVFSNSFGGTFPIKPYKYYGVEFGRQFWTSIDLAVFFGIEEGIEKVSFKNDFQYKNVRYLRFSSRFTPTFAFSGFKKFTICYPTDCQKLQCVQGNKAAFKFGLQDVFSFSRQGLYFFPKISYEIPFKKSPFTFNVKTETYFSRNKLFDYIYNDSNYFGSYSPKAYLNKTTSFVFSPQLKYFFLQKLKLFNAYSRLEGVYFVTDLTTRFKSLRVKRSDWSYQKNYAHSAGAGVGFQKIIGKKVLIDTFLIIDVMASSNDSYYKNGKLGVRSGIQYNWLH